MTACHSPCGQGEVAGFASLDLDDVRVAVAEVVLEQRDLPSGGEGTAPGGSRDCGALLGVGQRFGSRGVVVVHEVGVVVWGGETAGARLPRREAGRGEAGDDRLGVGDQLPIEGADERTVSQGAVPGRPVGVADHHGGAVAVGQDLVCGAASEVVEPLVAGGGGAEVHERVVGNGPRLRSRKASRQA